MSYKQLFGGVEAGGTKFVCSTGDGSNKLRATVEIQTRKPESTIREALEFFRSQLQAGGSLAGVGIGSFGPLELNTEASNYGHILTTPKPGWQDFDIRGAFAQALDVPVTIDTDVNAAVMGESKWGAARGLQHCLYVTVGTGIGVGAIVDGQILRGEHHPEMGHMLIPISLDEPDTFTGICPYHQSCTEGLASGSAIAKRWGSKLVDLPQEHPAWQLEAQYLAMFLSNLTFAFQPQRIVIGGGVMNATLLSLIHERLHEALAGYRPSLAMAESVADYLVSPELNGRAGVLGAIAMAAQHYGKLRQ